ncbi:MAG TPA: FtsQ-type POTRA domain-containing protein [Actinomycetota bacterium]|nr:FtsQ-type POTRA domain-containing protein [Actinomycetota bacterium]
MLSLATLAATGLVVGRSSLFAVDRIRVVGEHHVGAAAIVRRSGIGPGTNLLLLDPAAVERRIETDPWIRDATVTRSLPSTVTIRVAERTPVAVVEEGGRAVLVATDGTLLGPAPLDARLPVLAAEADALGGGAQVPPTSAPARALAALPPMVRGRVREVTVSPGGGLQLHLAAGTRVLFGTGEQAAEKGRVLRAILRWAASEGLTLARIDVRAPAAPSAAEA